MEQALVDHLCINELRCLPRGLPRAWVYVVCDKIWALAFDLGPGPDPAQLALA